ncbi:MAG: TonB-dependent receptor [Pseudobacter sp.]|uniref:TonB-dependent receptor n=1 Tax=Pseudobacter sp. TaxID=2045420 RepID=UPI003F808477
MRLTVLLLTVGLLHVHGNTIGQKVSLSSENLPLKSVFSQIEKQTGYVFFYNEKILANTSPVSLTAKDMPLKDLLDALFRNQPLNFEIQDKTIFLFRKELPTPRDPALVIAPVPPPITGTVRGAEGEPLPGVTISIKGQKKTVTSDEQGKFSIDAPEGSVLVFSSVGFEPQEHKIKGTASVNIVLKKSVQALSETVVIGYGSARRKDLTGSVSSVNVDEVRNAPYVSIDQALAGKATGVQVMQADGSPGGMARIRIRGGASLIGGNDPLYIIDGVQVQIQNRYIQAAADVANPVERLGSDAYSGTTIGSAYTRGLNTLAGLNINDIESIDILKDASATAIYGSRAANGVVIITTKKGKKNEKPVLEANYYTAMSTARTEKVMNADQYKAMLKEGATNLNAIRAARGQQPTALANNILNNPNYFGTSNTDWIDAVTRTGITNNADLSLRGGGTGSRYYASLAYSKQTGVLKGTDFSRISGKINLDNEITDRLRVITNLDYGFTTNNVTNGIYASALYAPPTENPYNADGTPRVFVPSSFGSNAASGIQNPLLLLKGKNNAKTAMILGSGALEYDIMKELKFRSTVSVNYNNYHQENYIPGTINIASTASSSHGGVATQGQTEQTDLFFENTLTWDKQFNENNRINVLGGTSWQKSKSSTFSASGQGFPDDDYLNGLSSANLPLPPKQAATQNSLLSFYLRANYAWKEKYLFTVTGRSDASSKFPRTNRVGYFPSAGVAWRINEEGFMKNVSWVDELKVRASAGYTGTQNIGDHLFYTIYTPASYGGANASIPTQLGNDQIKWESTLQKDAGIDFSLFKNRLRGSFGYYEKKSEDLLMALNVATSSGFTSALVNFADIRNRGLEIDLRGDIIRNRNFSWNLAMNLTANRSKVLRLNRDLQDPKTVTTSDDPTVNAFTFGNTIIREGEPVGLIFGYRYLGVLRTQAEVDEYYNENTMALIGFLPNLGIGDARYKMFSMESQAAGFPAREVIGRAEPKFFGGITNMISYKNFSLIVLLTYSYGGELLYLPDMKNLGLGDRSNRSPRILNHYTAENPTSDRPRLVLGESQTLNITAASNAVHDASYIKLKSTTLNYNLPQQWLNKLKLRTASLYVSGNNLLIVTGYPGPDPETSNDPTSLINGYSDAAAYPTMRQYSAGVRIGF